MKTVTDAPPIVHTIHTVSELIKDRWESDEPDQVLDALRPFDGKPITTRLLAKLPGGKDRWLLRREYGMSHFITRDYFKSGGETGYSFLIAHTELSIPLNVSTFEQQNPAYFIGRCERNHKRMEAVNTRESLQAMADVLNDLDRAQRLLISAAGRFDALTAYDQPFSPERYAFEKLWKDSRTA